MTPPAAGLALHQGVVVAWNSLTGQNTIFVSGAPLEDVPVLTTADSVTLPPGSTVVLMKDKSSWFILGRVAEPGAGALGIQAAADPDTGTTAATSYGNLSIGAGPTLTDVYIGSSRRCLVIISTAIYADVDDDGAAHFAVSGDSTINPPTGSSAFSEGAFIGTFSGGGAIEGTATKTYLLTSADGLNTGLNTFTMKYLSRHGGDAQFSDKVITVFPF
jgi:hypothetical protein